jgi:serine protease inhibitor
MKITRIFQGNVCAGQAPSLDHNESLNSSARLASRCALMAAVLSLLFLSSSPLMSIAQAPGRRIPPIEAKATPRAMNATDAVVIKGNAAFALSLYRQLRSQARNFLFSPDSISNAFAMAYGGARGKTASEIAQVFHFPLSPKQLLPAVAKLLAHENEKNPDYQLNIANALWAQENQAFLPAYRKLVEENYAGGFHQVDFQLSPESARNTINQWVEKQTNSKIQNLLPSGAVDYRTRLVLTNAVYFKGDWLHTFDKHATREADFHVSSSLTVKAPLMHQTGAFSYLDAGTFQALELPYKGDALAMVVLLPKGLNGLSTLEQSLAPDALNHWIGELRFAPKVIVTLPRFNMSQQFDLSSALSAMGMPLAFNEGADFSGMTSKHGFTISAAVHKAFIDVNETGTEATAATSITLLGGSRSMHHEPPPVIFRADHPFLFLICDTRSGNILFLGRVIDPTIGR